ncbi:MAG: eamA [Gammaproteobacteria bacterium]|jgi:drug/metabolite transporter (DMT)-like permease|nr:eamA [Gammaproteobacteria bacterium]
MNKLTLKTKLALLTTVVLWASAFVAIRAGLQGYSPGGLALLRFLIASVAIYFVFYRSYKERPSMQRRDLYRGLFSGVVGIGCYNIALNYGETLVPSGMASFIVSQMPVVTTLLAVFLLRERITRYGCLGMILSAIGVAMIALSHQAEFGFYLSVLYVIFACLAGGIYNILQKPLLQKYKAVHLTAYAIWGGTIVLSVFLPDLIQDVQHTSFKATLVVVYLALFPGVIGYSTWAYALSKIPATRAASFLYAMPIFATLIGWIWLGEVPTMMEFLGGLVALSGVWIVNHSYRRVINVSAHT